MLSKMVANQRVVTTKFDLLFGFSFNILIPLWTVHWTLYFRVPPSEIFSKIFTFTTRMSSSCAYVWIVFVYALERFSFDHLWNCSKFSWNEIDRDFSMLEIFFVDFLYREINENFDFECDFPLKNRNFTVFQ